LEDASTRGDRDAEAQLLSELRLLASDRSSWKKRAAWYEAP
jgi:hypothetical protein